jgi:hypothetical protein
VQASKTETASELTKLRQIEECKTHLLKFHQIEENDRIEECRRVEKYEI